MEFQAVDSFEPIVSEWDDLATRAGGSPFVRPGWFEAWWSAFGRGRPAIVTARDGGRLVGVAPLYRRRGTTHALSNVHSPEFAFLAADAAADRALAERVFAASPVHTSFAFLDAGSPSAVELLRAARARRRHVFVSTLQRSPYVEVDGGWERFEAGLAKKFVTDLRRRRRALEREGAVAVEVADGSERREELFAELLAVEPSGWKEGRGTSIASSPQTRAFYERVAAWASGQGFLRIASLRLDGRPLAVHLALEANGVWYFLKGGVDPEARRFAPGKLLVHALLERAFDNGLRSYEFLGADEPWKNDWQPAHRELVLQHSFSRTPVGFGWNSAVAAWRSVGLPLARRTVGALR